MKLNDKILHKAEDIIYLILSILVLLFIVYEIVDLVYIFFSEVLKVSFLQYESISKIGVPIFFNIIIALEIFIAFLQAYVFVTLMILYLNDILHIH